MSNLNQKRYIPDNSVAVQIPNCDAVVYHYTDELDRLCMLAYRNNRVKNPSRHIYFKDEKARHNETISFLEAYKKKQHNFKIGDIIYMSYGYDARIVEFYQIIETTEKSVTFRELRCHTVETGNVSAIKDDFLEKSKQYTRKVCNHGDSIPFRKEGCGSSDYLNKWNGEPLYQSYYY